MASASGAARLCLTACRRAPRLQTLQPHAARSRASTVAASTRSLSTSAVRWAPGNARRARQGEQSQRAEQGLGEGPLELNKMDAMFADSVTTENLRMLDELASDENHASIDAFLESYLNQDRDVAREDKELLEVLRNDDRGPRPLRQSFWYDADDPNTNTEEHDEFDEDDMTSMAHGKLDEIREMRHYMRLAVWEMPLLSKLAKPFSPPSEDEVLRWRYTTYMGELHPAEKKVVVQFAPDDLKLTPQQTAKLKLLVGTRYNPETELVKMSCESFEHQAQNKRYLMDLVDRLVEAAKDPTDAFADIPLDTRHHQVKEKPRFPKEWRMTEDRQRELAAMRDKTILIDKKRDEQGLLVDGKKILEEHLIKQYAEEQKRLQAPELVAAGRGPRQGGNRLRR